MKKFIQIYVAIVVIFTFLLWLLTAYLLLDPNPLAWSDDARESVVFILILGIVVGLMITPTLKENL